jgi:hypothetical protein
LSTEFQFEIGERVRSKPIGLKDGFEGFVVDRRVSDNKTVFYLVADVKDLWHRDAKELCKVVV